MKRLCLYFSEVLKDVKANHYSFAVEIALRPSLINSIGIRRKMFLVALQTLRKENFRRLLDLYVEKDYNFVDSGLLQPLTV